MFKRTAVPPARSSQPIARPPLNMALDLKEQGERRSTKSTVSRVAALRARRKRLETEKFRFARGVRAVLNLPSFKHESGEVL